MYCKKQMIYKVLILIIVSFTFFVGCQKEVINQNSMSPEEQLDRAKRIFQKKDYYKAKTQLTIVVLNNPGHLIIEEAQFYLAETHYYLKEYFEAIAEYEKLIRSLPSSPFVDNARFKVGMCYFKLAPGYALDQEYRYKAVSQFQLFLEEFPDSELRPDVEKNLNECRTILAKKEYKTGELYRKMGYFQAAIISFDGILENFYETKYAPDALFWKGECYKKMGDLEKSEETFQNFLMRFPENTLAVRVREKLKEVREELKEG